MTARKQYPEHAIHETKVHRTLRDVIEDGVICPNCRGHGTVVITGIHPQQNKDKTITCPVCGGSGYLDK